MYKKEKVFLSVTFVLTFLFTTLLSKIYFDFSCFEPDTTSYLFQAKIFARGRLYLDPPPEFGFSPSPHINILNGKWYSKYPFGNALLLAFGVLINAPWIVPTLISAITLILIYFLVKEIYNVRTAMFTIILTMISPAFVIMGATWFSEYASRFFLALFLLFLIKSIRQIKWQFAAISGFALGYAFNTRPLTAFAFGICGGVFTAYEVTKSEKRSRLFKTMIIFLIPFAFMISACLAWNYYFTGNPLEFTYNAAQPYDTIGFGKRSVGYKPDMEHAYLFTLEDSWQRLWKNVLPCVSVNILGWGFYTPGFYSQISIYRPWLLIRIALLLFTYILVLVPLFHRPRDKHDFLFFSFFVSSLSLYSLFYFDGSTFGFTAVNARYYNECTVLGLVILIARAIVILWNEISSRSTVAAILTFGIIGGLLFANTVHTYILQAKPLQNWGPEYRKLPKLVKEAKIHNAVVFIPRHTGAPIGEYPFKKMKDADIIYFKLGPNETWGLISSDWEKVMRKYFPDRQPYIYENGAIRKLGQY